MEKKYTPPQFTKTLRIGFLVIPFFALFLLIAGGYANAAIYYVATNGSDSNSGSSTAPFGTIQKAASIVNPGDTVIVRAGVYTDKNGDDRVVSMTRGGTASNWITFKSETKWGAVLDGQSNTTGYGWVFSAGSAYIRVEGFEIKGTLWQGFHSNAAGVHDIYLYGNKIHDIGRVCTTVTNGRNAFYQGKGTYNFTYDSNIVYTIGRLHTSSTCGDPTNWYNHDHGIYMYGTGNDVINNVFYDLQSGWGIQMSPGAANINVVHNTFSGANPGRDGQITLWGDSTGGQTGVLIENNIFNQPQNAAIAESDCSGDSGIKINNNITSVSNMISGTSACLSLSGNKTGTDPKLADTANDDFHLQSTSPAISKGIYTGLAYDADGNARTVTPDIGAYEYVGTTTTSTTTTADTTAPSTPTGLTASVASSSQINLAWIASTDNVGVAGYKVYRNGTQIATSAGTSYSSTGLAASTTYSYTVAAYDAAGNVSAKSAPVSATTQAASSTTTTTIIIDNGKTGTSYTGTWSASGATGYYGTSSLWSYKSSSAAPTYTWSAALPKSGTYDVYVWWTSYTGSTTRSTAAPYTVTYNGGSQTIKVNQQVNGGKWNKVGTFTFGTTGKVTLTASDVYPVVESADAVKFVSVQ